MNKIVDEDKIVVDLTNLSQDAAIWGLEALAEQYVNYDEKGHPRLPVGQNKKWLQVLEYAITKIRQAAALKEENERLKKTVSKWSFILYDPKENTTLCTCDSCQSNTYVFGNVSARYCSLCGAEMENGGERIVRYGFD